MVFGDVPWQALREILPHYADDLFVDTKRILASYHVCLERQVWARLPRRARFLKRGLRGGAHVLVGGRGRAEQRDDGTVVAVFQEALADRGEHLRAKHEVQHAACSYNPSPVIPPLPRSLVCVHRELSDFIIMKKLGDGSYSVVKLATERATDQQFASQYPACRRDTCPVVAPPCLRSLAAFGTAVVAAHL